MFGRKKGTKFSTGGRLVYAIGDIHGRNDLLVELLKDIKQDCGPRVRTGDDRAVLVFLGDYVDRGGHSRQVIEHVMALRDSGVYEVHALKGNHEEAFLRFLGEAEFGPAWAQHGGAETLTSYGVKAPTPRADDEQWVEAHASFVQAVPVSHQQFLSSLELTASFGDYLFVHAGVRPGIKLADQIEHDLLWIRGDFLKHRKRFEKRVVHGHTPATAPEILPNRICVDTGAYASGLLTAIRLLDGQETLIQARVSALG